MTGRLVPPRLFHHLLHRARHRNVCFSCSFLRAIIKSSTRYVYIGDTVASPALFSLPPAWAKACFGIALGNFLLAAGLYSHTAAKIVFVRYFRHTKHMYKHTVRGWVVWAALCFTFTAIAFVFAIAVPIFSYLIGAHHFILFMP
jgi:hypothetical protein